jgi:hypothetical protein
MKVFSFIRTILYKYEYDGIRKEMLKSGFRKRRFLQRLTELA